MQSSKGRKEILARQFPTLQFFRFILLYLIIWHVKYSCISAEETALCCTSVGNSYSWAELKSQYLNDPFCAEIERRCFRRFLLCSLPKTPWAGEVWGSSVTAKRWSEQGQLMSAALWLPVCYPASVNKLCKSPSYIINIMTGQVQPQKASCSLSCPPVWCLSQMRSPWSDLALKRVIYCPCHFCLSVLILSDSTVQTPVNYSFW